MTNPDHAAFVDTVRKALCAELDLHDSGGDQLFEGAIDPTALAEAAIAAMVQHLGPSF
jgi:hypothetical protein